MSTIIPSTNSNFFKKNVITLLLERIIPNVNTNYDLNYQYNPEDNIINIDFMEVHFIKSFLVKSKYDALQDFINNNFIMTDKKQEIFNYFNESQKMYWRLKKIYFFMYLKKKVKISDISSDLMMNQLSNYNQDNLINLLHNDTIYPFYINDLIRIINTALLYAPQLFSEPLEPKNPYINIPFSKANLYSIYFKLKNSNRMIPKLINIYYLCEFNITKLSIEYEAILREEVIKHYYDDASELTLYNDIILLLRRYKEFCPDLKIHPEFSRSKVVSKFFCLLKHSLVCDYSYQPTKRLLANRVIITAIKELNLLNPNFGQISNLSDLAPETSPFTLRYNINANLLDPSLEDTESIYELLNQLIDFERHLIGFDSSRIERIIRRNRTSNRFRNSNYLRSNSSLRSSIFLRSQELNENMGEDQNNQTEAENENEENHEPILQNNNENNNNENSPDQQDFHETEEDDPDDEADDENEEEMEDDYDHQYFLNPINIEITNNSEDDMEENPTQNHDQTENDEQEDSEFLDNQLPTSHNDRLNLINYEYNTRSNTRSNNRYNRH